MTEDEFRAEVQKIIDAAPPERRPRLQGLQWKCDQVRMLYKDNPTKRMLEMNKLMWESFHELNEALKEFRDET